MGKTRLRAAAALAATIHMLSGLTNVTGDYFTATIPGFPTSSAGPKDKEVAFDLWRHGGVDVESIALRGATHLEYASTVAVPLLLTATRYGQDMASACTLA